MDLAGQRINQVQTEYAIASAISADILIEIEDANLRESPAYGKSLLKNGRTTSSRAVCVEVLARRRLVNAIQLPAADTVQKCDVADRSALKGQLSFFSIQGLHMPDKLRHRQNAWVGSIKEFAILGQWLRERS